MHAIDGNLAPQLIQLRLDRDQLVEQQLCLLIVKIGNATVDLDSSATLFLNHGENVVVGIGVSGEVRHLGVFLQDSVGVLGGFVKEVRINFAALEKPQSAFEGLVLAFQIGDGRIQAADFLS